MNLFLRLLMTFIRARLSKETPGLFETTRIRSRVMLTDQDMFAHMTNSRYFSFSDLAIINYIVRTGCWTKLRKQGWFPVVCSESVTFARMLRAHQAFTVETRLVGWTDTYICLEHCFLRGKKETATVRIVARFASRKKDRVLMEDVTALLGVEDASPELPDTYLGMIDDVQEARTRKSEAKAVPA
ncbi:acyl-CoA thioesterase [Henriciella aquimarina]|uniref:acyl-CoA thioesterase n=1 Tax=Henriciella aquimarina TaxID=545261 RepID=UPI0009FEA2F6|nr:acyl-CoA thioesterase [Henriciella aquimarina]